MLQAGKGVLGPDSDTATNVSQLGAFPGVPFKRFGTDGANMQPRFHMQPPEGAGSIPALSAGRSLGVCLLLLYLFKCLLSTYYVPNSRRGIGATTGNKSHRDLASQSLESSEETD